MNNYSNSSETFLKHPNFTMNNYCHTSDIPSSSLRSFYNNQFSSSAIMASFTNNHHIHHQQPHFEDRHQIQHHHFTNNYDASLYSSSYSYPIAQYNPYTYQPLTPPPHQNDSNLSYVQSIDSSSKKNVFIKAEKHQNQLFGEYFKSLSRCSRLMKGDRI